jgi:hypothetical protein
MVTLLLFLFLQAAPPTIPITKAQKTHHHKPAVKPANKIPDASISDLDFNGGGGVPSNPCDGLACTGPVEMLPMQDVPQAKVDYRQCETEGDAKPHKCTPQEISDFEKIEREGWNNRLEADKAAAPEAQKIIEIGPLPLGSSAIGIEGYNPHAHITLEQMKEYLDLGHNCLIAINGNCWITIGSVTVTPKSEK